MVEIFACTMDHRPQKKWEAKVNLMGSSCQPCQAPSSLPHTNGEQEGGGRGPFWGCCPLCPAEDPETCPQDGPRGHRDSPPHQHAPHRLISVSISSSMRACSSCVVSPRRPESSER